MLTEIFTDAFADQIDAAASWYIRHAEDIFAKFADTEDGRISSRKKKAISPWNANYRFIKDLLDSDRAPAQTTWSYGLDRDALELQAKRFGEQQVAGFVAKLSSKLQGVTDVEVIRANSHGNFFKVKASLAGRHVVVEQARVLKTSSKGKLFMQWPARIYVDGKFISEEDFKALAAAQA